MHKVSDKTASVCCGRKMYFGLNILVGGLWSKYQIIVTDYNGDTIAWASL